MYQFYDPNLSADHALPFRFRLNADESRHCVKVLRMRPGEKVRITNGKGFLFSGMLTDASITGCEVEITGIAKSGKPSYSIHIAISPVKNMARFEWFLEKATEIGIDQVTPLICAHTEKISVRTERLKNIVTSAFKQSLGVFHPVLNEPMRFEDFVKASKAKGRFIAWCGKTESPLLGTVVEPNTDVIVLIGPEGDFSIEEVKMAVDAGYSPISLGKSRLRTETAALVATFSIHAANGSF